MNPTYDFTGQVALVTGASSGIGLAAASAFAISGAAVVLADIDQTALDAAVAELAAAGHHVLGIRCDVTDEAQVEAMVSQTVTAFGHLDMAFNNAGIAGLSGDQDSTPSREAHIDRLHAEVRWLPCSPRCADWLRYGIQPDQPGPGLVPGRCSSKAHDREHLGCGGRRVLVSATGPARPSPNTKPTGLPSSAKPSTRPGCSLPT
jgi:hypothetical protein